MKFLLLFLLLLYVQVQMPLSAAEPKWDPWRTVSTSYGVQVEYRTKPYVTKTETKTAVQWRVRNQLPAPVNVELVKTYRSHAETQRTEKVSALRPGTVYDPSPDYVPGVVHNVQVSVRVTGKDGQQQQQQPAAAPKKAQSLTQEQLDEIAELKRHVAAVQAQKMNPAPAAASATQADPTAAPATQTPAQRQTFSAKGEGPFDSDEPDTLFGWTEVTQERTAYVSQIYQFKGRGRQHARAMAFLRFLEANGLEPLDMPSRTECDEYQTLEAARKYWTRRKELLSSALDFRVVETQHVWR